MAVGPLAKVVYHPIAGFRLGTTEAGMKVSGRKDLVVMEAQAGSSMAGVFTANAFCAAPVHLCRRLQPLRRPQPGNTAEQVQHIGANSPRLAMQDL